MKLVDINKTDNKILQDAVDSILAENPSTFIMLFKDKDKKLTMWANAPSIYDQLGLIERAKFLLMIRDE